MIPVSVNISPKHIQLQGFVDFLRTLLAEYPEDIPNNLELEVVETSAIGDTSEVANIMNDCASLGVHFSLDDFGTGYSSLTYFHRLPIDVLKIDQRFVKEILADVRNLDIVEGVLRLAEALDRPVVAEGVESVEIGLMLLHLGCRYAQGYGIARPMPANEVNNWLESWQGDNIWFRLPAETKGLPEYYDLNVSIFSHRLWLDKVINCFEAANLEDLPELDESRCQFGRWYEGIGRKRYGDNPSYAFIAPKHGRIHELAKNLKQLHDAGNGLEVKSGIEQLKELREELLSSLRSLAK